MAIQRGSEKGSGTKGGVWPLGFCGVLKESVGSYLNAYKTGLVLDRKKKGVWK